MITFDDFLKVDIRVGQILEVEEFPEARNPSYRLKLDFGEELGVKKSCAQLANLYTREELMGKHILAVVNFPPKQIGPAMSEVLVLGVPNENNDAVLITPTKEVPLGGRLY